MNIIFTKDDPVFHHCGRSIYLCWNSCISWVTISIICIAQYRKYTLSNQYPLNLESNRFCFWQIRDMTHPRTDPMDWMRSECICILMRDLRINEHSILRQTAFTCRQSYIRDAKQFLGIIWKSYPITPRSQILYGTTWNPKAEFLGDEKLCLDTLCYPVLTHLTPLTPSLLEEKKTNNKQNRRLFMVILAIRYFSKVAWFFTASLTKTNLIKQTILSFIATGFLSKPTNLKST